MTRKLLIATGPQGSGNHLFSKIFSQHPEVNGWTALQDTYWQGHRYEPFAKLWRNPSLVKEYDWSTHQYHMTSISYPCYHFLADYDKFIQAVQEQDIEVKLLIIGRDQTILSHQENRVRTTATYEYFLKVLPTLLKYNPIFVSQELVYLYKETYIQFLAQQLDFPVLYNSEILKEDANAKYITPIDDFWLDDAAGKPLNNNQN